MKIKFLRDCTAPQMQTRFCCDMCGHVPTGMEPASFFKDDEDDPELWNSRIDLTSLKFGEDYTIIEYP